MIRSLIGDERAASLTEYAVMLSIVAPLLVLAIVALRSGIIGAFASTTSLLGTLAQ